ncbi:acyltransferase [Sphingomonas sp. NBWT7]|uniref:acyltransferase family protein n=1 Tax=Sphingomonas sp. NBWT7 TaxID=2596913 RepID=UPI0016292A48|nr:acyltransferase [Sphingomonas sp. NBWT7]QNE32423.1 acyltransferase [Sphingomonas sp. NBWT7]
MDQQSGGATHLHSLQYLRAIAALLVVYFHAVDQVIRLTGSSSLPPVGASGVDIFFVLSGFVMWWTTSGRDTSPRDFILKRIVRVAPLYWILTLCVAALSLAIPRLLQSTQFDGWHIAMSLLFLPAWHPLLPAGTQGALVPVIVPGWTLNVEVAFYLLFALALRFSERQRPWIILFLLATLYVAGRTIFSSTPFRFYGTDLLAEFAAGLLLARLIGHLPRTRPLAWAFVFALALPAMLVMDGLHPPVPQSIHLGVPALLIVLCAVQVERAGGLRRSAFLALLGNASYSIYLSHIFTVAAMRSAMRLIGVDVAIGGGSIFVVVTIIAAVIGGIVVHLWLEKPLLALANNFVRRGKRPPASVEFARS